MDIYRFQNPVTYNFSKPNDEFLKNIISIFIFLKNISFFVDICLNENFMRDIYQKNWHNIYNSIFYLRFSKNKNIYNSFQQAIEAGGIKFLKLNEMCDYLVENIYD